MNNIPKAPKPEHPAMMDRALAYMQDELVRNIGWLDHAFGRAQRLVTMRDGETYYYPGVYIGGGEYMNVLPGQGIGNRTFFFADDPHSIDFYPKGYSLFRSPVSLVCWYDLSDIFPDGKDRNTEEIKRQFMRLLENLTMPDATRMVPERIYERAENIFDGYSLREIDTQFLMQPYAGLRIEGSLIYREECL